MTTLRPLAGIALALAVAACSSAATPSVPPTPSPIANPTPGPTFAPTASPTASPLPSPPAGAAAWPTAFDIELDGTYWSNPPFRIPFEVTIEEAGWFSGHLHETFLDLQRFDGITPHQFPNRMLGFGDPDHIRGDEGNVDVATLTPDAALELLADRASLDTSNHVAQALFGIDGARMDLHSATNSNPLFGDPTGDFGLGPQLDIRLVLLPFDGKLFVVAVLAAPGDLDGAWEQALPILESVRLAE